MKININKSAVITAIALCANTSFAESNVVKLNNSNNSDHSLRQNEVNELLDNQTAAIKYNIDTIELADHDLC